MSRVKMSLLMDGNMGRPAAILGGGPSLQEDMTRLPEGALLIAVNYHAQMIGIEPAFMVYNDDPESDPLLNRIVMHTHACRVSPHPSSDIEFDIPVWTGFYSSNTAAWFALWMGCNPVILCGMDCYQGEKLYCHPSDRDFPSRYYPLDDHLRPWIEDGRNLLPHKERLFVMSGPLTRVFPVFSGSQIGIER